MCDNDLVIGELCVELLCLQHLILKFNRVHLLCHVSQIQREALSPKVIDLTHSYMKIVVSLRPGA